RPPAPQQAEPPDWQAVRAEIHSLVVMGETMLDTIASQLRQDEQAARHLNEHLGDVDARLEGLSERMDSGPPGGTEPDPELAGLGAALLLRLLRLPVGRGTNRQRLVRPPAHGALTSRPET